MIQSMNVNQRHGDQKTKALARSEEVNGAAIEILFLYILNGSKTCFFIGIIRIAEKGSLGNRLVFHIFEELKYERREAGMRSIF